MLKSGYIHKRGRSFAHNWKRRFCILEKTDGQKLTLAYYDKPNGSVKGSVFIYSADKVLEPKPQQAKQLKAPYEFTITIRRMDDGAFLSEFQMALPTSSERDDWAVTIRQGINSLADGGPQSTEMNAVNPFAIGNQVANDELVAKK